MTYTEQAAVAVAGINAKAIGGPNWDALLDMLGDLVRQLMSGCAPTPAAGYEYLTREFAWWERVLGADRRRERAIHRAVERAGGGPGTVAGLLNAIAGGKLTPALMAGLYAEARR